ncbi:MAG: uroporphyrinogen decarboxylase family protein [Phycisphaerae bacterium]|jgi:uroporphyrinogen decarboxylase|nr:uroporphyrinogen decarboxylase family protein [Phycisphaerae bacterium]
MNSKERVLTSIARQVPDRIPVDFSANRATLQRLMSDFGASDYADLLGNLKVDIVDLRGVVDPTYRGPAPERVSRPNGVVENFWGMRTKTVETATGPEDCYCDFILADAETADELAEHRWPEVDWFDFADFSDRLEPWADLAIMASGPSVWQHATFLRGIENMLTDLIAAPDIVEFLMDRFTDFYVEYFDRMLSCAGGRIDILRIADDLAMQDRLMVSPGHFDGFFAPRLKKLIDMAHSHRVHVMHHSCGAVVPLIERLIDLGVDILDPIQVTATGMDPRSLKSAFGDRLCLHGAIDTQHLLPRGSPDDVSTAVRRTIDELGPDGFILSPSHVLQTDVSTANVRALYQADRS